MSSVGPSNFIVLNFSKVKCHKTAHSKRYVVGSLWPVTIYFVKKPLLKKYSVKTGAGLLGTGLVGLGDLRKN